ncbi:ATP-dependent RNA helicase [Spironucleus salmonicida]|uniref:ATP-dependent RNA helicase n=1 Tax=Spironucleus salmonicida TaxID=348837 RepID=V6LQX9_9EUKA|nr:ATP-dependent RNA helicase [Spironucleus salmonicida]|eukprot:EST46111.1 ATP-dependent RNA helicase [Spironucleus salmonicida]
MNECYIKFIETLNSHRTILVTGPTGCGKSTQIPQFIADSYPNSTTLVTQPRRLAVTQLTERISQQSQLTLRKDIGFVIGRRSYDSPLVKLLLATTGSAINILMKTPYYYDFIIIDEIHEMSAEILQIISLCIQIQKESNIKIILMSATVDPNILDKFQDPVIFEMTSMINEKFTVQEVPMEGQLQALPNIETYVVSNIVNNTTPILQNMAEQVKLILLQQFSVQLNGDILCFVPGLGDFRQLTRYLAAKIENIPYNVVFVHSRFSNEQKALQLDQNKRNVIISTNICETSLTIPSLSYVVDSCLAKQFIDDTQGIAQLQTIFTSMESLIQRSGRIGRCQDGCYIPCLPQEALDRLQLSYSKGDIVQSLPQFILTYYQEQEKFQNVSLDDIVQNYSIAVEPKVVHSIFDTLIKNQYLQYDSDAILIQTKLGSIININQVQQTFFDLLNLNITGSLIMNSFQSDLEIFIHPFEQEINSNRYLNAMSTRSFVKLAALFQRKDGIQFFYDQSTNLRKFQYADIIKLFSQLEKDQNNFSDYYAKAKIVALWRQYFPIYTLIPTEEELYWCRERLLNPDSLREYELSTFAALKNKNLLSLQELCILAQLYDTTSENIERYFEEIRYDFSKSTLDQHQDAWQKARLYFNQTKTPIILQLLQDEYEVGYTNLVNLVTTIFCGINQQSSFTFDQTCQRFNISTLRPFPFKVRYDLKKGMNLHFRKFVCLPNQKAQLLQAINQLIPTLYQKQVDITCVIPKQQIIISFTCSNQEALKILCILSQTEVVKKNNIYIKDFGKEIQLQLIRFFESWYGVLSKEETHPVNCGAAYFKKDQSQKDYITPFFNYQHFSIMTSSFWNGNVKETCVSQQGLAIHILRVVFSLTSEFGYNDTSFYLFSEQKQIYSVPINALSKRIIAALQQVCIVFQQIFNKVEDEFFTNEQFLFNHDFDQKDFVDSDKIKIIAKQCQNNVRLQQVILAFINLYGGIVDKEICIGCLENIEEIDVQKFVIYRMK